MKNDIIITISGSQKPNIVGGAIPAILTITNNTDSNISISLFYPNPSSISFVCESNIIEKKQTQYDDTIERIIPTIIPSRGEYREIYFLNRYFNFIKTGMVDVSFSFNTSYSVNGKTEEINYNSSFPIEVSQGTGKDLEKQFHDYSDKLKSSNTKQQKEAIEALSFIETPLCIPYVIPMLSIKNMEVDGIKILSRFPSLESKKVIAKMLSHKDSNVVFEAVEALKVDNVIIPRSKFIEMLSSPNANIRLIGLENLEISPDIEDKKNIKVLLTDINEVVAKRANKYYQLLSKMN